jgi:hypothetical protein
MQLTKQDIRIVEKVVTTENGVFLARFAVVNVGGVLRAKLVSMVALDEEDVANSSLPLAPLLLETPRKIQNVIFTEPLAREIVSPYSELFFLTSQSPRAPTFC